MALLEQTMRVSGPSLSQAGRLFPTQLGRQTTDRVIPEPDIQEAIGFWSMMCTRCATLAIMPRVCGVSGSSTMRPIRLSLSPIGVYRCLRCRRIALRVCWMVIVSRTWALPLAQPSLNQSPIAPQNVEKPMEKSNGKVARSGLEQIEGIQSTDTASSAGGRLAARTDGMRRFSSMKYAVAETRRILRDRFARYLPVIQNAAAAPGGGSLIPDEAITRTAARSRHPVRERY